MVDWDMADHEEHSQPIASDPGAIRERLARIETLLEGMSEQLDDLKDERHKWLTRADLVLHAEHCTSRKSRPTSDTKRLGFWAAAQQRLGVITSAVALLALVAGAWIWTARTWSSMERQLKAGKTERRQARREDRADRRALLNKLNTIERKKVTQ